MVRATRSYKPFGIITYDTAEDMTAAATSDTAASGQPSNATSEAFTFDDWGLPLTASGSAWSTSYTWNGDGQQAAVADRTGNRLTDAELDELRRLSGRVAPPPWRAMIEGRDYTSGDSFIMIGIEWTAISPALE